MILKEFTDEEFIGSFLNFNRRTRPAINIILERTLDEKDVVRDGDMWSIYMAILENYFFMTETTLMLLTSFHTKKENPSKSLAAIYCETFISEGEKRKDTEKMLNFITKSSNQELLDYLGLKSIQEIIYNLNEDRKKEMVSIFGSVEDSLKQSETELNNLRESISIILRNRILNKDNLDFPFYKVLNKLKHGYQIIPVKSENLLCVLIGVDNYEFDKAVFDTIPVPFSIENAKWFSRQTRIMSQVIQLLLMAYSFNLK